MESVSIKHDDDHAVPPLFRHGREAKKCCSLGGSNIAAFGRAAREIKRQLYWNTKTLRDSEAER